jgi:hypothetical protein
MKQATLSELADRIRQVAEAASIGAQVRGVSVAANDDEAAGDYLQVVIRLTDLAKLKFEDVRPLLRSIEDAVAEVDDRFPSVRFADAA